MLLKKLMNWKKESPSSKETNDTLDLSIRIREISSRIAISRSGFESNGRPNQTSSTQPQPMVAAPTTEENNSQESKQKDLNDLKAKLLGKNK
jgi:hypothetical protein